MKTLFSSKKFVLFICVSLILDWNVVLAEEKTKEKRYKWSPACYVVGGLGGVAAVGFGAGGIVASSIASKLMSVTATAYGGGVPAGSFVAWAQSLGATGTLPYVSALAGSALGAVGCKLIEDDD